MAKLVLNDITASQNETEKVNQINSNSAAIEVALENTLSRDGTSPNEMEANLDMNSNRILNLPAPVSIGEPIRKAEFDDALEQIQDIDESVSAAAASAASAAGSASAASTSASQASTSATNAATSATNAANSATAADNSVDSLVTAIGLIWAGPWALSTAYTIPQFVSHNGATYAVKSAHTSGASTEPGVGASWTTVWDLAAAAGSISAIPDGTAAAPGIAFGSDLDTGFFRPTTNTLAVSTAGVERWRTDLNGQLLIGNSASYSVAGTEALLQLTGTNLFSATRWSADGGAPNFALAKSRSTTPGTFSIVQNGDNLGNISFCGDDGTDLATVGARIRATVVGTPGVDDMPTIMTFWTTPDGSATPVERVRITDAGQVVVGGGVANTVAFSVIPILQANGTDAATSTFANIRWSNNGGTPLNVLAKSRGGVGTHTIVQTDDDLGTFSFEGSDGVAFQRGAAITAEVDASPGTGSMPGRLVFSTSASGSASPTERMRITSAGNVTACTTTGNFVVGSGTLTAFDKFGVVGGRSIFAANNEPYAIAMGYNLTRFNASQVCYLGATDSATPSMLFSNAGGGVLMTLVNAGNLGVGTQTPVGKVHVLLGGTSSTTTTGTDSNQGFIVEGASVVSSNQLGNIAVFSNDAATDGLGGSIVFGGKWSGSSGAAFARVAGLRAAGTYTGVLTLATRAIDGTMPERMRINETGNVGIGTTSPLGRLHIKVTTDQNFISAQNGNGADSGAFGFITLNDANNAYIPLAFGSSRYNFQLGNVGINTTAPTELLDVNGNAIRIRTAQTPASASAAGNAGEICWDTGFIYVCTATNTWKRVAIATW